MISCINSLSQSLGFKIHISEATKCILESLAGFAIEERGEVYLKVSHICCVSLFPHPALTFQLL